MAIELLKTRCRETQDRALQLPWSSPVWLLPCRSTWVMVHRSPDSAAAVITTMNPHRLNFVSPATRSSRPEVMMVTTSAKLQLGLHTDNSYAPCISLMRCLPSKNPCKYRQ